MTIKELIQELSNYDESIEVMVYVPGWKWGGDIKSISIEPEEEQVILINIEI